MQGKDWRRFGDSELNIREGKLKHYLETNRGGRKWERGARRRGRRKYFTL
jgi:hypothetical protein